MLPGESIFAHISRPYRPIGLGEGALAFFDLPSLGEELKQQGEFERSGVAAITLTRDEYATHVLVALRRGSTMREHRAPSAGSMVLLSGRVAFVAGAEGARTELEAGSMAVFAADVPHAVEALEDAAYLVILGGRDRRQAVA